MPSEKRNTSKSGYTKAEREALRAAKEILDRKGIRTTKKRGPAYRKQLAKEKAERQARGRRQCRGTNQFGEPCGASPLRKGTDIEGVKASGNWCLRHDPDVPEGAWNRFVQEPGTEALKSRPKQMRPMQAMAMAMATAPGLFFEPYLKTLGVSWDPETGEMVKKGDGAKIVGFSREGYARVSKHDDLEAQQRAAERLWDRMFGKPRQSMELAGGSSGMTVVQIPRTDERARIVSQVLMESGAVSNLTVETGEL